MIKTTLLFSFLFICAVSFSQKELTLDSCLQKAIDNPRNLISEKASIERAEITYQFGKFSFLPSFNLNSGINANNGRKLDPFTNTFGSNTIYSSSYGLNSQLYVFNGFRYFHQNKMNLLNLQSSEVIKKQRLESLKQEVLERFVSVWKIDLQIQQQKQLVEDLKTLRTIQQVLIKAGKLSAIDTLQTSINIKQQHISFLNYEQNRTIEIINLNYLMGDSIQQNIQLQQEGVQPVKITFTEEFDIAKIETQLDLLAAQNKLNQTQFYPSVSMNGFLNTGYSTNNKDYTIETTPTYAFNDQFKNNRYQGVGLNLNIPIFNKGQYFEQRKIYQISKTEQEQLATQKALELEKKKLEVERQLLTVKEILEMNKTILEDRKKVYELNQLLYQEGKIRLNDLEKIQAEYYNIAMQLKVVEVDLFRLECLFSN